MKKFLISLFSLLLIIAILAPSIVKLSHALFEHQEQLCKETGSVHIHEIELDCDFQKFNLSPQTYPIFIDFAIANGIEISEKDTNRYSFLSKYQTLHFSLRGPPSS